MTILLQGSTGALYTRLGKLGALVKNAKSFQSTQYTAFTDPTTGVTNQYDAEQDIQAVLGGSFISSLDNLGSVGSLAQQVASLTINRMVFRDNPRINQTLSGQNTVGSLLEVFRQMGISNDSVLAMTIAITPTSFVGVGNGAVVGSTKRASDGRVLENSFAETLLLTITNDSYSGGAVSGNEPYTVTGVGDQSNLFAFNWPLGSNSRQQGNAIDGSVDVSSGNILTNSGWDAWTASVPNNWTIESGSVAKEAVINYDGLYSLSQTGDGSTLVSFSQTYGTQTTGTLSPSTQYAVNLWARRDGVAAAAGTKVVELVDSNGVVINDNAAVPNSFSINLTTLTTGWVPVNGTFRTPSIMPSTYKIRLRDTVALTNGRTVYFDRMGNGVTNQVYANGPSLAVFSGHTPFLAGDYATAVVTNSRGAAGTLSTWQTLFWQLFPEMSQYELLIPSSATPTISDSLIG